MTVSGMGDEIPGQGGPGPYDPAMTEPLDVDALRADTPGCRVVVHLNNAGSSLPTLRTVDTVVDYLRDEAVRGGYEKAELDQDRIEAVYDSVARLIGARRHEIALVESATRAWDLAFYGFELGPGDRVLTSRSEYASNMLAFLHARDRHGIEIVAVDDDEHGQLDVDALAAAIDERTALIAVNHVPTQSGLVNAAEAIGAVANDTGVPFLLDACQSVGQLRVDVHAIGCDLLSATGRKYLRGPRGTGFLYVREAFLDRLHPPMIDLESATWTSPTTYELAPGARRFEDWEASYACRLGLGAAVDYALDLGLARIEARVVALGAALRERLGSLDGVRIRDRGERLCGIVTFTADGVDSRALAEHIGRAGINVSTSTRQSAQLDLGARDIDSVVRASVHYYNTVEELDRLVEVVAER